jgi:site-specific recombinase XerD
MRAAMSLTMRRRVAQRLAMAVDRAAAELPGLKGKHVSPHTLRHTAPTVVPDVHH